MFHVLIGLFSLSIAALYNWNIKMIGLKLIQPLILLLSPFSLIYVIWFIMIMTEDYYCLLMDIMYLSYMIITDLKTMSYKGLITFMLINAGLMTILMSLKAFLSLTLIVGNIINIYMFSLMVILMSFLINLLLFGLSLIAYLLYLFLTKMEFFLFMLFVLESFSNLFQSLTLANRLSINLMAGSLLTFLLSNSSSMLFYFFFLFTGLLMLLLLIYCFEMFNCFIQLFMFLLLSYNYINNITF